jgi:TolB-like protein
MSRLRSLIQEIHRRSLWQVLGIYLGGAWVALQGIEALVSVLGLPEWVPGVALVALIVGLPIVLATAFVQEGVGAGEAPAEAPAEVEGLHLVLTWKNVALGGLALVALAGVGVAGWLLLGGEVSRSPDTIRSIAVLPLENLTGDPGQEYFADGMTEAVISEFARLGALNVISRTSVMQYKDARKPLPQIAQELGVQGVVEGSVFRAGDRVRITLQLIDARSDLHLWAQTYERNLRDVLALQADVAREVAEQIRLALTPEEDRALTVSRTVDPRAYDAYLRAHQLRGPPHLVMAWGPAAIEEFQRSVELDPGFAEGWTWLAEIRLSLGITGFDLGYRSEFPKARKEAQRALEIDDRLGVAHAVLGVVRLYYDWDFPGARRALEQALRLSPSNPEAVNAYAWYLMLVETRTTEALKYSERLLRVAPVDPIWRGQRFKHLFCARQYERALEEVKQVQEMDPHFVDLDIATSHLALGQVEEAHRVFIAFFEGCGSPCDWMRGPFERGWAEGGPDRARREWLEEAKHRQGVPPGLLAINYAAIGEIDEAFAWLERGYRERDPLIVEVRAQPGLDPLRSDPRFDDLLRRIGFPEE